MRTQLESNRFKPHRVQLRHSLRSASLRMRFRVKRSLGPWLRSRDTHLNCVVGDVNRRDGNPISVAAQMHLGKAIRFERPFAVLVRRSEFLLMADDTRIGPKAFVDLEAELFGFFLDHLLTSKRGCRGNGAHRSAFPQVFVIVASQSSRGLMQFLRP